MSKVTQFRFLLKMRSHIKGTKSQNVMYKQKAEMC